MPAQKLYLDEAKTQKLELRWGFMWKNCVVSLNGVELGRFADKAELRAGREFILYDGSRLHVMLDNSMGTNPGLRVSLNGEPVKGSTGDPHATLKSILILSLVLGGLNIVVGLVAMLAESEFLTSAGIGYPSVIIGLLIGVLGYLTWKQKSMVALGFIIGLYALDFVLSTALAVQAGANHLPGSYTGVKVVFIIMFARGFRAIREIKQAEQRALQNLNAPRQPY